MKVIINKYNKSGKIYYDLQCNSCGNIQSTPHSEYINNRCKKCLGFNPLYIYYNGSYVFERVNTSNKFEPLSYRIKCHCNKDFIVRRDTLRNNVNKGKKIQCSKCNAQDTALLKREFVKVNQLSTLFDRYRRGAKVRGHSFSISLEDFKSLVESPCYYCGTLNSDYSHRTIKYLSINGIDRKDNSIGYEIGNCLPCCKFCNIMKQTLSEENFLNQVDKIFKFQNNKNGTEF